MSRVLPWSTAHIENAGYYPNDTGGPASVDANVYVDPKALGGSPSAVELFYGNKDGWDSKVVQRQDARVWTDGGGGEHWDVTQAYHGANPPTDAALGVVSNGGEDYAQQPGQTFPIQNYT